MSLAPQIPSEVLPGILPAVLPASPSVSAFPRSYLYPHCSLGCDSPAAPGRLTIEVLMLRDPSIWTSHCVSSAPVNHLRAQSPRGSAPRSFLLYRVRLQPSHRHSG